MSDLASNRQVAGTHYRDMGVQPWDVIDTWPRDQKIGYYRGGALKYLMRMGAKDESEQEIARMLSGETISDEAILVAKNLKKSSLNS